MKGIFSLCSDPPFVKKSFSGYVQYRLNWTNCSGSDIAYASKTWEYNDYLCGLKAIQALCLFHGYGTQPDKAKATSIWKEVAGGSRELFTSTHQKTSRESYERSSLLGNSDASISLGPVGAKAATKNISFASHSS